MERVQQSPCVEAEKPASIPLGACCLFIGGEGDHCERLCGEKSVGLRQWNDPLFNAYTDAHFLADAESQSGKAKQEIDAGAEKDCQD